MGRPLSFPESASGVTEHRTYQVEEYVNTTEIAGYPAALSAGQCVIDDVAATPGTSAVASTAASVYGIGICVEDIPAGRIGRIAVSGGGVQAAVSEAVSFGDLLGPGAGGELAVTINPEEAIAVPEEETVIAGTIAVRLKGAV